MHAPWLNETELNRIVQTSILRALPPFVPVYLFPAMNTHMYTHPLTAIQLKFVTDVLGYIFVGPISKLLACGDQGSSLFFLSFISARVLADINVMLQQDSERCWNGARLWRWLRIDINSNCALRLDPFPPFSPFPSASCSLL